MMIKMGKGHGLFSSSSFFVLLYLLDLHRKNMGIRSSLMAQLLKIDHCHCYGLGLVPSLGTSALPRTAKKKKKKKAQVLELHPPIWFLVLLLIQFPHLLNRYSGFCFVGLW